MQTVSNNIPLLRIHSLDWTYPGNPNATLNNLSLELHQGDFCFVIGKSGIGKTTIAKCIMRQLQPPKGTVFHHRDDIARYSSREIQAYRRKLGIVFQDCKLLNWQSVKENIIFPLRIESYNDELIEEKLEQVAILLDLTTILEKSPRSLSGGERQRVAIARALIRDPEFLIADEPTGNIDEHTSQAIMEKCIEINKQGTTILFITHDHALIDYVAKQHPVRTIHIT